jgi:predicted ATPase
MLERAPSRVPTVHAAVDEAIEWSEREERWYLAELLRIKGELLRREGGPKAMDAAANFYLQALDRARQQNALSRELRISVSLAKLQHGRSTIDEAYRLLSSVYDQFTEGLETADLREARALMNDHRTDGR